MRSLLLRRRRLALIILAVVLFVYACSLIDGPLTSRSWLAIGEEQQSLKTDDSAQCKIPKLNLHDPSVERVYHTVAPLKCAGVEANWVTIENQTIIIQPAAVERHSGIDCEYTHFWRISDKQLGRNTTKSVSTGTRVLGDYAKITCRGNDSASYSNVYATVVPSETVIKRAKSTGTPSDWSGLNMYMLGFDSISRMTFMRNLPKVYDYLVNHLSAAVLEGYNIVGDGTPQAFIPILTAKTEEELPLTRKRFANASYVDVYPMIWKDFAKNGYVTMYGEDSAAVGTFTYRLKGFQKQPVDHYFRTFYQQAEHEYKKHQQYCFGNETQHSVWFRYGEELFDRYPETPKWSLLHHSALSHDSANTFVLIQDEFLKHLKSMETKGHLNNTLLIIMADHGHRFAKLRSTHQGQLEERLPMFSLVAPKWFRDGVGKEAWRNLLANRHRLTTPFDVHPTLQRLIHWRQPQHADVTQRSVSLWDHIPASRTCEQAGIDTHWCTCLDWETLNNSATLPIQLATAVVAAINNETERERKLCAVLRLVELTSVRRLVPNRDLLKYKGVKDIDGFVPNLSGTTKVEYAYYQLRLRTEPGGAHYEATVGHDERSERNVNIDLKAVSHINRYGDNPKCIIDKDYFLAKWCVCVDRV